MEQKTNFFDEIVIFVWKLLPDGMLTDLINWFNDWWIQEHWRVFRTIESIHPVIRFVLNPLIGVLITILMAIITVVVLLVLLIVGLVYQPFKKKT